MTPRRFCTTCQCDKPSEGFRRLTLGRIPRWVCEDCRTRKKGRTAAERDAFGREVSARNKALRQGAQRYKLNANTQSMIKEY